jgi:thiamine-phosphate pyrophosphorylase
LLTSAAFLALSDDLVRLAGSFGADVIVNDRADLARISGAAGVHVGQDDLPPQAARDLLGPAAIVGYSTHTIVQIESAAREPITYLAVGPVFGTTTKDTGYAPVGVEMVREAVARAAGTPVVAIGGITLERVPSVIAAGASAVAVIGDLLTAGAPQDRVAAYCRALM